MGPPLKGALTLVAALACLSSSAVAGANSDVASGAHGPAGEGVIGLSFRGLHRAYPMKYFSLPTVVNDLIRQQEVAVYHDPERGISAAYFRLVLGEPIEFSGKLSGTVADDLTTITRWDMSSGKAVGGNLLGMDLVPLPIVATSLAEWLKAHPDSTLFSPAE